MHDEVPKTEYLFRFYIVPHHVWFQPKHNRNKPFRGLAQRSCPVYGCITFIILSVFCTLLPSTKTSMLCVLSPVATHKRLYAHLPDHLFYILFLIFVCKSTDSKLILHWLHISGHVIQALVRKHDHATYYSFTVCQAGMPCVCLL